MLTGEIKFTLVISLWALVSMFSRFHDLDIIPVTLDHGSWYVNQMFQLHV